MFECTVVTSCPTTIPNSSASPLTLALMSAVCPACSRVTFFGITYKYSPVIVTAFEA